MQEVLPQVLRGFSRCVASALGDAAAASAAHPVHAGAGELLEAAAAELVAALAAAAERAVAQRVGDYGVEARHQSQVLNLGSGYKGHDTSGRLHSLLEGALANMEQGGDVELDNAVITASHAAAAGPAQTLAAAAVARAAEVKIESEPVAQ
jgi:hypothetical protein